MAATSALVPKVIATMDSKKPSNTLLRAAQSKDLAQLCNIEQACFANDRLSKRRLQYWISAPHGIFMVACDAQQHDEVLAYALVIMRKGSRSARLYSIAVHPEAHGKGLAKALLLAVEQASVDQQRLFMRLEVAADNHAAISLYDSLGYRKFGVYERYYENQMDALRMQKPIKQRLVSDKFASYPWFQQTTEFTCGPSSLMMAMHYLDPKLAMSQALELDIWRQATTIFMTSGHGGCHPIGLGIAATERGFSAKVYVNTTEPLFLDGVRSEHKKAIMRAVDAEFWRKAQVLNCGISVGELSVKAIRGHLNRGAAVISLISTYQFDGKKAPHWVAITHVDDNCLYLHDPDPDEQHADPKHPEGSATAVMDYQHIPIAIDDFMSLSVFGKTRLRTTIVIEKTDEKSSILMR